MHGMMKSFPVIGFSGNIFLLDNGYNIIQIKEEEGPMYAISMDVYYLSAIAVMVMMLLIAFLVTYLVLCSRYRKRIRELDAEGEKHLGWRLWRLRSMVNELELQKAERLIREMQDSFQNSRDKKEI